MTRNNTSHNFVATKYGEHTDNCNNARALVRELPKTETQKMPMHVDKRATTAAKKANKKRK